MTDRELIEKAANAAGFAHNGWHFADGSLALKGFNDRRWNPITDDGDALRLAMKLNLLILPYPEDNAVRVVDFKAHREPKNTIVSWGTPPDALAATRRAITMAAASLDTQ